MNIEFTIVDVTNLIYAIASLITAIGVIWNLIVTRRGVRVSTQNADALGTVLQKQDTNKTILGAAIQSVRHDLHNGAGDAIAKKVIAQTQPVIEKTSKEIVAQVAQTAADVAAALVKDTAVWNGKDQRVEDKGPPEGIEDRRQK